MLLCLATIADTLAQVFTLIYFKLCCGYCHWNSRRRRCKNAALSLYRSGSNRGLMNTYVVSRKSTRSSNHSRPHSVKRKLESRWDTRSLPSYRSGEKLSTESRFASPRSAYVNSSLRKLSDISEAGRLVSLEELATVDKSENPYGFYRHKSFSGAEEEVKLGKEDGAGVSILAGSAMIKYRNPSREFLENCTKEENTENLAERLKTEPEEPIERNMEIPQIVIIDVSGSTSKVSSKSEEDEEEEDREEELVDEEPELGLAWTKADVTAAQSLDISRKESRKLAKAEELNLWRMGYYVGYGDKIQRMPVSVGILIVVLFIFGGAVLFSLWEDWNLIDGAYYSFITLSTIGFGDIVPGRSLDEGSQEKLILCSFYLLFGMALIAMCFKLMQDNVVQKAKWLGRRMGLLVKEESFNFDSSSEEDSTFHNGQPQGKPNRKTGTVENKFWK